MDEIIEQFLATIIEQCLGEHDMQPPLVVRTVGDNGSVLVAGIMRMHPRACKVGPRGVYYFDRASRAIRDGLRITGAGERGRVCARGSALG